MGAEEGEASEAGAPPSEGEVGARFGFGKGRIPPTGLVGSAYSMTRALRMSALCPAAGHDSATKRRKVTHSVACLTAADFAEAVRCQTAASR